MCRGVVIRDHPARAIANDTAILDDNRAKRLIAGIDGPSLHLVGGVNEPFVGHDGRESRIAGVAVADSEAAPLADDPN